MFGRGVQYRRVWLQAKQCYSEDIVTYILYTEHTWTKPLFKSVLHHREREQHGERGIKQLRERASDEGRKINV